ncbi:VOC family protein [Pedobacter metabolipauper]|uniref:4-hydroxyphenylpyruvate dioxygenase-like putative hemolysin n=1 Tax=Pedobacter metabolipauper TaxID=425513 RepID=A0A4R6SS70_9SPHI|nr:VOC family protein [Pedobacter metabolipauper]TDQ08225.1 4-hydroxyphenylpyruvate dioxygenase-like putative hemolysin [Pedobacter metabolipauper]
MSNLKKQIKATAVASALLISTSVSNLEAQEKAGVIGVDHIGINVPDMNQAVNFFTDVFGFSAVTTLGPIPLDATWKKNNRMQSGTGAVTIKMVKAGTGANIELFEYKDNNGSKQFPGGDDLGASHIAFYTDDIKQSVTFLKSKGVQFFGEPFLMPSGDTEGETWVYFLTPWGAKMELVSYPNGKGYEKKKPATILWSPKDVQSSSNNENQKPLSEAEIRSLVETHLAIWNENDLKKREALMKKVYAENIEMVDGHFIAKGFTEINGFVEDLQKKAPVSKFTHTKVIDVNHNIARLFWQNGTPEKPDGVTGMDLFVFENGKAVKLYVFVDTKK